MSRSRFAVAPVEARTLDGITFASKKEMMRYSELKLLQRAGVIHDLQVQPSFPVKIDGQHFCTYTPDFRYLNERGEVVVEELKSSGTAKDAAYRLRRKAMELFYRMKVVETVR
ncbi:DUF1064 domain-containing protein [Alsobacter sp. KACC 23698]|uniref:DUF1064 domain-containing protein n=1 Tax=Alsobacter sp. KACC 23698 TaxID=3149229 RepID=A0AAU7J9C6_9HYPH